MNKIFYKILTPEEWEKASLSGIIETDLDIKDGFIHLSTAQQLAATLAFYFANQDKAILLQPDYEAVKDKLKYETTKLGDRRQSAFPHLYDKLEVSQITQIWHLERGAFILPEDILLQVERHDTT
tara:strand:- start:1891 stop:2265 length:375 start_codon:yes stop_codon:yes gene_type:complete